MNGESADRVLKTVMAVLLVLIRRLRSVRVSFSLGLSLGLLLPKQPKRRLMMDIVVMRKSKKCVTDLTGGKLPGNNSYVQRESLRRC